MLGAPQAAAGGASQDGFAVLDEMRIAELEGPVEGAVTLQVTVE